MTEPTKKAQKVDSTKELKQLYRIIAELRTAHELRVKELESRLGECERLLRKQHR